MTTESGHLFEGWDELHAAWSAPVGFIAQGRDAEAPHPDHVWYASPDGIGWTPIMDQDLYDLWDQERLSRDTWLDFLPGGPAWVAVLDNDAGGSEPSVNATMGCPGDLLRECENPWMGSHHTLVVQRKGGKTVIVPLAPRTARTVYLAIGGRDQGSIFLNTHNERMDGHQAARAARRLAKRAGIENRISPNSLRHSFITAALDAGVPLRDVQEAASHADPRTTMRYDRARRSLDRHATYIVATFVAGASR